MTVPAETAPRFRAGEPLPAILLLADLAVLLGLSRARIYELYGNGEFARFEVLPRLGNRPRFSGARVQAWIDGTVEPVTAGSRYLGAARRRKVAV
jgi:predicted DNA-binding transcriptional regulator AlpA